MIWLYSVSQSSAIELLIGEAAAAVEDLSEEESEHSKVISSGSVYTSTSHSMATPCSAPGEVDAFLSLDLIFPPSMPMADTTPPNISMANTSLGMTPPPGLTPPLGLPPPLSTAQPTGMTSPLVMVPPSGMTPHPGPSASLLPPQDLSGMIGFDSPCPMVTASGFISLPGEMVDPSPPSYSSPDTCATPTTESQEILYQKLGLSPNLIKVMNRDANSRQNFAAKLVKNVFSKKERDVSNVHGRKGKKRLDPERMSLVRKLTYSLRPLKPGEDEDLNWKKHCATAIDTANRKDKDSSIYFMYPVSYLLCPR